MYSYDRLDKVEKTLETSNFPDMFVIYNWLRRSYVCNQIQVSQNYGTQQLRTEYVSNNKREHEKYLGDIVNKNEYSHLYIEIQSSKTPLSADPS